MFDEKDLRQIHCVTTVEKLLWNINENLAAIRKAAEKPVEPAQGKRAKEPQSEPIAKG